MKRLALFFVALGLSLQAFTAHAYYWEFREHSVAPAQIQNEISGFISRGYVPVGLTFLQGRLNILYVNDGNQTTDAWYLGEYGNQNQLQRGLDDMGRQGYTPMGLSYYNSFFYVIYVRTRVPINRWALITSGLSLNSLQREISPYTSSGFIPFGLASTSQQFLTLLVDTNGINASAWTIEEYALNRNAVMQGLNNNEAIGNIPWGFLHHGGRVYILYLTP